jgi:ATP-dependent DNA ligase
MASGSSSADLPTAAKVSSSFVIDGEAVALGVSVSDFNALRSNKLNDEAQLYAFDLVALDTDNLRELPLFERKARLAKLLARRPRGAVRERHDRARPACRIGPKAWSQNEKPGALAPADRRTGSR